MLAHEWIPQIANFIIAVANIFWSLQLKQIQTSGVLLESLRSKNKDLEITVEELLKKKNEYKLQYQSLHSKFRTIEGELNTYKKLHKHE